MPTANNGGIQWNNGEYFLGRGCRGIKTFHTYMIFKSENLFYKYAKNNGS